MSEKKKADIIIGGNVFTITGQDAAAKGDRIAKLVNETIYKVKTLQSSRALGWENVLTLALINLADDLIAEQDAKGNLKEQLEAAMHTVQPETPADTSNEVSGEYAALLKKYRKLQAKNDDLMCDLMNLEQEIMDLKEQLHE